MYTCAHAFGYAHVHVRNHVCMRVCLRPDMAACLCLGVHVSSRCRVLCGGMMHVSLLVEFRVSLPVLSRIAGTPRAYLSDPPLQKQKYNMRRPPPGPAPLRAAAPTPRRAHQASWWSGACPPDGGGLRFLTVCCVLSDLLHFIVALRQAHVPRDCLIAADSWGVPPSPRHQQAKHYATPGARLRGELPRPSSHVCMQVSVYVYVYV